MFGYRNIVEDLVVERLMETEEDIPVIISAKDCECDDLEEFVKKMGGRVKHKLNIINAVAAYMPNKGVRSVAMERVIEKIQLDDRAYKLMNIASETVASDYANEHGLTGKGISVAVIDTGVYPHSDLTKPTNRIVGFKDFVDGKTSPYDDDGHGTHVAGIIAGNGFSSRGKYMGVAPDANIVGVKVLDKDGGGSISDVIAGIQWVIANKAVYNIKVITLSLGTKAKSSYVEDPLCKAVDAAARAGITVVVAAGNNGPSAETINSPAISPHVISVGACDDRNGRSTIKMADFSSRGPAFGGIMKPDIIAPGVGIHSLGHEGNDYISLSGTSMATPIVSGSAALLYELNSNYSPTQIKDLLTRNALPLGFPVQEEGAGLLDLRKVVDNNMTKPIPKEPVNNKPSDGSRGGWSYKGFNGWFIVILLVVLVLFL